MKRLFALALALVILAVPALADDNPLADYSMEELQGTAAVIQAEILRRAGEPFTVYPGIYVIGVDIPAGTYRIEMVKGAGKLFVFTDPDDVPTHVPDYYSGWFQRDSDMGTEVIGRIVLQAGMAIDLGSTVTFVPYTGVGK